MKRPVMKNDALWAIGGQFLLVLIFSIGVWLTRGKLASKSFLIGGMICVLPNIYLYFRVFAYQGARQAHKILSAFYWGEAVKIILTACLFVIAFKNLKIMPLWLFLGYIIAQLSFWIGPLGLSYWKR